MTRAFNGKIVSLATLLAAMTSGHEVHAQALGQPWDVTVGVERVFGFYSIDIEREISDVQTQELNASSSGFAYQPSVGLFDVPRVGIDVFVTQRLSVGGSIGFYSNDPDESDDESDDTSGFLFAPRVGYVIPFNFRWGFWPRGGFSYVSLDSQQNVKLTALTLEGQFYFMPSPFVGITGGLLLDLGLTGEWGGQNRDYDERLIGLGFGLFARF